MAKDEVKRYLTFNVTLNAIINGDVPLPFYEVVKPEDALNWIALHRRPPFNGNVILLHGGSKSWARIFCDHTQGGTFEGSGLCVLYGSKGGAAFKFAICQHDKVADKGANPRRGWHPAHCVKCGLDMTVDSGD